MCIRDRYCAYVLLSAMNGVTEGFKNATMSDSQVNRSVYCSWLTICKLQWRVFQVISDHIYIFFAVIAYCAIQHHRLLKFEGNLRLAIVFLVVALGIEF